MRPRKGKKAASTAAPPPVDVSGSRNAPPPPHMPPPAHMRGPIDPLAAHTELQRALLAFLVEFGSGIALPARPDVLLRQLIERYPEVAAVEAALHPGNVERALHELARIAPHAVRVERSGELTYLEYAAIADFHARLTGGAPPPQRRPGPGGPMGPGAGMPMGGGGGGPGGWQGPPPVGAPPGGPAHPPGAGGSAPPGGAAAAAAGAAGPAAAGGSAEPKRKRSATLVQDDELAEVLDLVDKKSIKQQEKQGEVDELLSLLSKPSARQSNQTDQFRTAGGSKLKEFCRSGTKEDCARVNGTGAPCDKIHFRRIIKPHTDMSLGDCSYLDTCRHMDKCKFIHYEVDAGDAERMRDGGAQLDPFARTATNRLGHDPFARHYESQFINCDIRTFPMPVLGKFPVIMADPPWDIHMELPYGTMADDEMRRMNVQVLQDDGVIFLWVTGRAMELGRECLDIWGYRFVQEVLWVKTNQLQRIIRTGRTGHWINHSKEHCLVGIKGNPTINSNLDCDVVCAEVRETSRKPDEMYDLLERLAPGGRKLELFGRPHNVSARLRCRARGCSTLSLYAETPCSRAAILHCATSAPILQPARPRRVLQPARPRRVLQPARPRRAAPRHAGCRCTKGGRLSATSWASRASRSLGYVSTCSRKKSSWRMICSRYRRCRTIRS